MNILKNSGSFEILSEPKDVIKSIASAARVCKQTQDKSNPESDEALVKLIINQRHFAMLEFADITVQFNNCSRGMTHELVRHRIASFAQESTRYVDESNFNVVVPPNRDELDQCICIFDGNDPLFTDGYRHISLKDYMDISENVYSQLRGVGWKAEDARQVLPTAIKSQIVIKANIREWREIFSLRCDRTAHWEIRKVMLDLLVWCKVSIPIVFDDFKFFIISDDKLRGIPDDRYQFLYEYIDEGTLFARQVQPRMYLKACIEEYLLTGGKIEDIVTKEENI
jgi:thymidylate synthase (FAD)